MDTVTQMALGAAVGELTLGDRIGNRAIYWGAGAGLIPDFDIVVTPFVSEVQALTMHRAFLHSLLFVVLFSPLLGAGVQRVRRLKETTWKNWTIFFFWVLLTHIVLDCLTTYGTQIFQPFSNYKVSLSTIFVIDPLYTVPLIAGIIAAMQHARSSSGRRRAIYLGVGLSSLYLIFAAGAKLYAHSVFQEALDRQNIAYQRLMTVPTPFNSLLWTGMARTQDTVSVGLFSLLDGKPSITFRQLPRSKHLLSDVRDEREVQRLIWFSDGYYAVDRRGDHLYFHDLRFGRNDVWLTETGEYIFTWKLLRRPDSPDKIRGVRHQPNRSITGTNLRAFGRRILGSK
jgi:inner membrane protein